ncbi:MAG: peptide chain release factor N(5)-glutamine methyltransferase [Saccharofermentanales bacterium]|jgi:release factor glutamine methyltransferase|nr:peptide chain release factor N(5)-glutamine methyltransferase [Clostridiaceae bacterium]
MMTIGQLQMEIGRRLADAGLPDGRREAAQLIAHYLETEPSVCYTKPELPIPDNLVDAVWAASDRRMAREPMAYITGGAWFMGNYFKVGPGVLIPRPDSEILVEQALEFAGDLLPGRLKVIDVCTGSGCIGISIGLHLRQHDCLEQLMLTEIDPIAARYARLNLQKHALTAQAGLEMVDLLPDQTDDLWHLIVSNPPYIAGSSIEHLMPEVRDYEPRNALDGGPDGLLFVRRLIQEAAPLLYPGGVLLLEHGFDQGEAVYHLFQTHGEYTPLPTVHDYGGRPRVSGGIKKI